MQTCYKKDLTISASANFAYNQNRVTKLSLIEDTTSIGIQVGGIAGGIGNTVQIHSLNNPTFSYLLMNNYMIRTVLQYKLVNKLLLILMMTELSMIPISGKQYMLLMIEITTA